MESSQPENCAKCGSLPEDILMLTCNHDLCLVCSAKNYHRELMRNGEKTRVKFFTIIQSYCSLRSLSYVSYVEHQLSLMSQVFKS